MLDFSRLDAILEREKITSRKESWNKLDSGLKVQKLRAFAEEYCRTHSIVSETEHLRSFLGDAVGKKKLTKVKDVAYNRASGCVVNIPSLCCVLSGGGPIASTRAFTLRNTDKTRICTLKSLAPRRQRTEVAETEQTCGSEREPEPEPEPACGAETPDAAR